MIVVGLRMKNWGRFRGVHELDLGPGVWGIVAQDTADPRASNWRGKSSLLWAIRWALFGELPEAWDTIDAAISHGETEMSVDVELSDGSLITRSRSRGKAVQLLATIPTVDGERDYIGDAAQAEILTTIGIGSRDFAATCWVTQRQSAAFILATPADRTAMVTAWLALEPLVAAAKRASSGLVTAENDAAIARRIAQESRGEIQDVVEADLENAVAIAERAIADARTAHDRARSARDAWARWEESKRAEQRLAVAQAELASVTARPPAASDASKVAAAVAEADRTRVAAEQERREVERLRALVRGEFDGRCPVMCTECPSAGIVRASTDAAAEAASAAEKRFRLAKGRHDDALAKMRAEQSAAAAWKAWASEVERRTTAVDVLRASIRPPEDEPAQIEQVPDLGLLGAELERATGALRRFRHVRGVIEARDADAEAAGRRAEVSRHAARILGRGGAQRKIAISALGSIAAMANETLTGAGIDLGVGLVYGREQQGLADVCDCGCAFPKSARAKVCDRCGAARGPKRDDRLYVEMSSRSGAAEDLAGVAIQLAAGRWLRAARGARWDSVILDEPFGALDEANRSAFAGAVAGLARRGWGQAFVVAHSPDVMQALPHRIVITSSGKWSSAEVE